MKTIKDIIPNITDEQIEQLTSVIVNYDGEVLPLNTLFFQFYSKQYIEDHMGVEITDEDWNRHTKHDRHFDANNQVFGYWEDHIEDILSIVPHK
tara:strand:+ start:129 stop:410 length:282 start_codon:yes stop_codon:yes gene_type:complete